MKKKQKTMTLAFNASASGEFLLVDQQFLVPHWPFLPLRWVTALLFTLLRRMIL
jgi:hypothetical protein